MSYCSLLSVGGQPDGTPSSLIVCDISVAYYRLQKAKWILSTACFDCYLHTSLFIRWFE